VVEAFNTLINMRNKKAQTFGLISGIIFGVASLVIAVIIAFVIVSTLSDAELLNSGRGSETVVNETGTMNSTGHTLTHYSDVDAIQSTFSISSVYNETLDLLASGNYTLSEGVLYNASEYSSDFVNVSYTYSTYSNEELSENRLMFQVRYQLFFLLLL